MQNAAQLWLSGIDLREEATIENEGSESGMLRPVTVHPIVIVQSSKMYLGTNHTAREFVTFFVFYLYKSVQLSFYLTKALIVVFAVRNQKF